MPLRPIEFHILVSLVAEERHGYGIMQEAARLGAGERNAGRIEPGTLYRALFRMLKAGWIAEAGRRAPAPARRESARADAPHMKRAQSDDGRRRYYRLTAAGRRVAAAEAERLSRLVREARAGGLLTRA
jgi:DNA-binding PadR family transcriptional regulator